jgi:hypothetical protein
MKKTKPHITSFQRKKKLAISSTMPYSIDDVYMVVGSKKNCILCTMERWL